jgi:hypothetical protein
VAIRAFFYLTQNELDRLDAGCDAAWEDKPDHVKALFAARLDEVFAAGRRHYSNRYVSGEGLEKIWW